YAINGGVDEVTGAQVGPEYRPITSEILDFEEVKHNFMNMMDWYFHNKQAMSVALLFTYGTVVVLAPFATKLTKLFGKKEASVFA
ncbi:pyruvate formate lyase family protein, partial [Enterococcus faecium]|uniref:pyruvate formate lyase family protein n=1 Tax=Enterococcus faecium TaxID=1352 RepID=UPI00293084B9